MEEEQELNKLAIAALVCSVLLLAPVALVLGVIAIVQILKRKESGLLFAAMAILISGVLVPGAAYSFINNKGRGMDACLHNQETAIGVLRMIHHLEERFHKREGRYGEIDEIQWLPRVDLRPYKYEVISAKKDTFLAVARGEGLMDGDELLIDQGRHVKRVVDKCRRR